MDHWTRMIVADTRIRELRLEADADHLVAAARPIHGDNKARASFGRLLHHVGRRGRRPVPTRRLVALKGAE